MLKVFLVEDESIVRDGLRDNIPWERFGYQFIGEASDGEMALPLIRKLKPDVLITDIKMPFMDGLSLSKIVTQENPAIKIIIISGYDEFEFAQQAIRVGVEQYLLKPITRNALQKALQEIREKIESEQEQKNYLETFKNEMHEYEQYSRRDFLEKLFGGQYSIGQIYEEAAKFSIELSGPAYCLMFLSLQGGNSLNNIEKDSDAFEDIQEELMRYFTRFPEYLVFRWNIDMYGILIQGDSRQIDEYISRCKNNVIRICKPVENTIDWHLAISNVVERLSLLPECYSKVNHIMAYRFLIPNQHILTENDVEGMMPGKSAGDIDKLDMAKVDPAIIKKILEDGKVDEIEDFVSGYTMSLSEALKSKLFRDYLLLSVRFTTISFVESLGVSQEEFISGIDYERLNEASVNADDVKTYIQEMLTGALILKEKESANQSRDVMKKALEYIDSNFTQESLSLTTMSSEIGVSPSYFSGVFSQEMKMTFTEYVTQKRMDLAKELLIKEELHTGEIAARVGYKDPHYFSFVFKKTQGCTPREYKSQQSL